MDFHVSAEGLRGLMWVAIGGGLGLGGIVFYYEVPWRIRFAYQQWKLRRKYK